MNGYMASDIRLRTTNNERGNILQPLRGLLFLINDNEVLYMHHPTDRIVYTTAFVGSIRRVTAR